MRQRLRDALAVLTGNKVAVREPAAEPWEAETDAYWRERTCRHCGRVSEDVYAGWCNNGIHYVPHTPSPDDWD